MLVLNLKHFFLVEGYCSIVGENMRGSFPKTKAFFTIYDQTEHWQKSLWKIPEKIDISNKKSIFSPSAASSVLETFPRAKDYFMEKTTTERISKGQKKGKGTWHKEFTFLVVNLGRGK